MKQIFALVIFIALFSLIFMLPVISAETLEDSVQQKLNINEIKQNIALQYSENPQMSLEDYIQNSPEFQIFVKKMIFIAIILSVLIIVDIILRGLAMWRAAKNNSKKWFWALAILNTLGILPLIYLLISKKPAKENKKKK